VLPARDTQAWEHAGMRFWAVSDVSQDDMAKFATAMQAAI